MSSNNTKSITILGSTGSIGRNTLDVIRRNADRFFVKAISANTSIEEIRKQIEEFHPEKVVIADPQSAEILQKEFGKIISHGEKALDEIATGSDIIVAAMVGFAGLRPTLAAVHAGKRICIANKETLVVAGEIIMNLAKKTGAEIIPIDSEHSAILQCLAGESHESIKRIILTASGGPFRTRPKETFDSITVQDALKHPNWTMGRKITIDSATLMNKGLEVIEARWLFDLPLEKIDVIIHPQSVIHSMVEFCDGSIKAQLGAPDMRLAIQYALGYPDRLPNEYDKLNLPTVETPYMASQGGMASMMSLQFEKPDLDKFPCLSLAREASEMGGIYPAVLNAANEIAVEAFLNGEIGYTEIPHILKNTIAKFTTTSAQNLRLTPADNFTIESIFDADRKAREIATTYTETAIPQS